jgi:hypothetical protein
MRNTEAVCMGALAALFKLPKALLYTSLPLRATITTAPGNLCASMSA